ncbi:guanylate kinase [Desulfovirgula thermocuniculi]|uniref:guanylate kinase n=1 Tax=Desulfovirgula thermocuniculi TaxID=348842 RepID=UPI0004172604|nr:guanylate kinase [Desulfovirgula thermocuniculi]
MKAKGVLLVLSGPSGAGKGTVCRALVEKEPNIRLSVSATTRKPRAGEVDGVNYFFVTRERFQEMIKAGELLEWAEVYGNYYGTPRKAVEEALQEGYDVLLEIDVQGGLQVKEKFPEAVLIFLLPPSRAALVERLTGRGTDSAEEIRRRLRWASTELQSLYRYDYVVINRRVEEAVATIQAIITAEKCRPQRVQLDESWGL